ncbi:MAG: peptidase M23 [Sulfurimonas sp.]|nr:MAG: peptidase M23 [Sulfurimonas sp.]
MKILFLIPFIISFSFALGINISDSTITNGRTAFIELKKEKHMSLEKITINKKNYKIYENPIDSTKMYALVPVSYYEKAKNKKVQIFYSKDNIEKNKIIFFSIKDGNYKKETIKVSKSKVKLNKKDKKRASKEYAEAMKIYNTFTNKSYISSEFISPMQSKITSSFGKARVYNGSLNGYHSGTDFRAKIGTDIIACNDGKVVLAKDRFYSGASVIINHGQGIYTCYYHMSKFNVKKGDKVKKAQLLGLSGKSGRVTGPHLHFSVRVGGIQVDPLQLIELLNKNLLKAKK